MKKLTLAVAALFTAAAPAAFAQYDRYGNDDRRYDSRYDERSFYRERDRERPGREFARVIETRPIHEAANTKEECWNPRAGHYEEVRDSKTRVGKGAAIGAIAGGVLGHQLGDNSNANTAAGAVLGGVLGHQLQRRNERDDQPDLDRSRCRVVAEGEGPVQGYEVRYAYRGNEYVTRMDRDPGDRLRIGRDVNPDGTPFDRVATNSVPPSYGRR